MSGHQPTLWHAGILAKLLAVAEFSRVCDARGVWIVPDMDDVDPTAVRVPRGRGESASAQAVSILSGDATPPGIPAGSLPPRTPASADPALPGLAEALAEFRDEPSLAMQVGRAVVRLACRRFGVEEPVVLAASGLLKAEAWGALVRAMTVDPRACAGAYNDAARAHPDAGVRPLLIDGSRLELPLWRARAGLPRLPVFSDQLASVPADELRPRALAMSAIVRAVLCDLFIHGLGGERYDPATDAWLTVWGGASASAPRWWLAPTAVATADALADLGVDPDALPDPAVARWRAHHARHDPTMLDDADAAQAKRDILGRINAAKAHGEDPAYAFADLQGLLGRFRADHAGRLAELDARAERAVKLAGVRELARDRSWPWPVLAPETLDALHRMIRARIEAATITRCCGAHSSSGRSPG